MQAFADWISQSVYLTSCIRSARAWRAWIWGRGANFNLCASGDSIWLGCKSINTGACGVAIAVDIAVGVWSTRRRITWIGAGNTSIVGANVTAVAVGVSLTLSTAACDGVRLRDVVRKTATKRVASSGYGAFCVGATGGWVAWIWLFNTLVVGADVPGLAVGIPLALSAAASDGIGFRDKIGQTPTDWIAEAIHHALGVGAAR